MSRLGTLTRRGFLVGTTVVGGAVVFGTYTAARPYPNPLADGLPDGAASFNPWVMIDSETITLITPHADIGQGVVQMQATLLAEELDLDQGQFVTTCGDPAPAYFNTGFATEIAAGMNALTGLPTAVLTPVAAAASKLTAIQATGGSTSVHDCWEKLRRAGASARETLKLAAAKRAGFDVADLSTRSGAVILPDGTRIPYQELAAEAATLPPVQNVALRPPEAWRLIGQRVERLDIVAKSTGRQVYGIDLVIEDMVHATVRVSPRRARRARYDDAAARALPGVRDVVEITDGLAVLADDTWSALRGARALSIEWAPAPYPAEQADHWARLEQGFAEDHLDATWRDDGDVAAVTVGEVVSAEYRAPYVAHQPLEPLNAIVRVTDEAVDIWTGHQTPTFVQQVVGRVTGHDPARVRLHNQYSGGSFGHRLEFEHLKQTAEIANGMRGTPVKLTYSREEDFALDFPRQIAMARCRGTTDGGRVVAVDIDVASPSVFGSQFARMGQSIPGPDPQIAAGIWEAPYAIDHMRVRAFRAEGLAPVSSWRSVGASSGGFFLEVFLDELIHAAGADPLEERLRLASDDVARGVLARAGEMAGWGRDPGPGRGLGVALVHSFGVPVAEIIEVERTDRGIRLVQVWACADSGTVVDPVNYESMIQGGIIWGLGHSMNSEITYADGRAEQTNFHQAEGLRLFQTPQIEIDWLEANPIVRGIGEPPVPPAAPALSNAIFAATGTRLREMPFNKFVDFA